MHGACLVLVLLLSRTAECSWLRPPPRDVMSDASNALGISLLEDLASAPGNVALSPLAAAATLVALWEGARGDTALQLRHLLQLPRDRDEVRAGFRDLHRLLRARHGEHQLCLADLFLLSQDAVPLEPVYVDVLRFYGYQLPNGTGTQAPAASGGTTVSPGAPSSAPIGATNGPGSIGTTPVAEVPVTSAPEALGGTTNTPEATRTPSSASIGSTNTPEAIRTPPVPEVALTPVPEALGGTTITPEVIGNPSPASIGVTNTLVATGTSPAPEIPVTSAAEAPGASGGTTDTPGPIGVPSSASIGATSTSEEIETTPAALRGTTTPADVPDTTVPAATEAESPITTTTTSLPTKVPSTSLPEEVVPPSPGTDDTTPSGVQPSSVPGATTTSLGLPGTTVAVSTDRTDAPAVTTGIPAAPGGTTTVMVASTEEPDAPAVTTMAAEDTTQAPGTTTDAPPSSDPDAPGTTTTRPVDVPEAEGTTATPMETPADVPEAEGTTPGLSIASEVPDTTTEPPRSRRAILGPWSNRLECVDTTPFLVRGSLRRVVPALRTWGRLPFARIPELQACVLQLPLQDSSYRVLLVLPEESRGGVGVRAVVERLRDFPLREVVRRLRTTALSVAVPLFSLHGSVLLTSTLQHLGVWDVFDPRRSDLSCMSSSRPLYVVNVEQRVDLDLRPESSGGGYDVIAEDSFLADRAFLFFVLDAVAEVALLAGKVEDPLSSDIT